MTFLDTSFKTSIHQGLIIDSFLENILTPKLNQEQIMALDSPISLLRHGIHLVLSKHQLCQTVNRLLFFGVFSYNQDQVCWGNTCVTTTHSPGCPAGPHSWHGAPQTSSVDVCVMCLFEKCKLLKRTLLGTERYWKPGGKHWNQQVLSWALSSCRPIKHWTRLLWMLFSSCIGSETNMYSKKVNKYKKRSLLHYWLLQTYLLVSYNDISVTILPSCYQLLSVQHKLICLSENTMLYYNTIHQLNKVYGC